MYLHISVLHFLLSVTVVFKWLKSCSVWFISLICNSVSTVSFAGNYAFCVFTFNSPCFPLWLSKSQVSFLSLPSYFVKIILVNNLNWLSWNSYNWSLYLKCNDKLLSLHFLKWSFVINFWQVLLSSYFCYFNHSTICIGNID